MDAATPGTVLVARGEVPQKDRIMKKYIEERGNGFPSIGDYVPGNDGNLYRVTGGRGRIVTEQYKSNRALYEVECADWDDCEEAQEFSAMVVVTTADE